MTLKQLRNWLNKLPPEFDSFTLCNAEVGKFKSGYGYRLDKPISELNVDVDNKEILFLNDIEKPKHQNNNNKNVNNKK
jgi:hypothetical protein